MTKRKGGKKILGQNFIRIKHNSVEEENKYDFQKVEVFYFQINFDHSLWTEKNIQWKLSNNMLEYC